MKVKAKDGVKVPLEYQPAAFIEQEPVEVEESLYYRRRIADGDLIVVKEPRKPVKSKE
ncbi:DUF2635 domain-containing protein [Caviibacterium pharyngocola]|uniref:DUF2635 domain-containing protein n=1 Tax=Caviibacterium pharyngocola TaxID=28159 RepID=A0A2M8RY06_9PAST|nr:DUF2635 domain-containing protein [Caviibacterium pharyngocola]PJG83769.1 DUF2635 domain-containing protein [Caviibacterium pharyngocola]